MSKKRANKVFRWVKVFVIARHKKGALSVLRAHGYDPTKNITLTEVPWENHAQAINWESSS